VFIIGHTDRAWIVKVAFAHDNRPANVPTAALDVSESSERSMVFGYTVAKRKIAVVYEVVDAITVYPITAYDVE
jgi:hypothetical protein